MSPKITLSKNTVDQFKKSDSNTVELSSNSLIKMNKINESLDDETKVLDSQTMIESHIEENKVYLSDETLDQLVKNQSNESRDSSCEIFTDKNKTLYDKLEYYANKDLDISSSVSIMSRLFDKTTLSLNSLKEFSIVLSDHYKKLNENVSESNSKNNIILVGETGCGKTTFVELACREINVPFIDISLSNKVGEGFKGSSYISDGFKEAFRRYGLPVSEFEKAIVFLDEFDKIEQTTDQDSPTKGSLQNELLRIISGLKYDINLSLNETISFSTKNMLFLAAGTFENLLESSENDDDNFDDENFNLNDEMYSNSKDKYDNFTLDTLKSSNKFAKDLTGRFTRLFKFDPLTKSDIQKIIFNNPVFVDYLNNLSEEVNNYGYKLIFDKDFFDGFIDYYIDQKDKAGFRQLHSTFEYLNNIVKEYYEFNDYKSDLKITRKLFDSFWKGKVNGG